MVSRARKYMHYCGCALTPPYLLEKKKRLSVQYIWYYPARNNKKVYLPIIKDDNDEVRFVKKLVVFGPTRFHQVDSEATKYEEAVIAYDVDNISTPFNCRYRHDLITSVCNCIICYWHPWHSVHFYCCCASKSVNMLLDLQYVRRQFYRSLTQQINIVF